MSKWYSIKYCRIPRGYKTDFKQYENDSGKEFKQTYNKAERIIIYFCSKNSNLNWGRDKIKAKCNISNHTYRKIMRELFRNDQSS